MNYKVLSWFPFITLPSILLSGCSNPINQHTANKYFQAASQAEDEENLELARENYKRANINFKLAKNSKDQEALSLYEYSRVSGLLGYSSEAQEGFLETLNILSQSSNEETLKVPTLCELSRLLYSQGSYKEALKYFPQAVQALQNIGIEESDPMGYCLFLESYQKTLEKVGDSSKANEIEKQIELLKMNNPNVQPKFVPQEYPKRINQPIIANKIRFIGYLQSQ
jgi:tetratricopeptide (TPR) repeat protein